MEIAILSKDTLRIKGKQASFIVDPISIPKTPSDAVILLENERKADIEKVEGYRVVIRGAGEYEIGGIKIAGYNTDGHIMYAVLIDGISLCIGTMEAISAKQRENIKECNVLIVKVENIIDESLFTSVAPSVIVLYGSKSKDEQVLKLLGKQDVKPVQKVQVTLEKLPTELEVVVLQTGN